jgi:hypothetical protein
LNVIGPFYVEDQCCTACGIPEHIAPELFAEDPRSVHCFVRKQPGTAEEIDKVVEVMHSQDLDCVRYGGDDPAMLRRLDAENRARLCDRPSARITR